MRIDPESMKVSADSVMSLMQASCRGPTGLVAILKAHRFDLCRLSLLPLGGLFLACSSVSLCLHL